jgi:hypothetical protein
VISTDNNVATLLDDDEIKTSDVESLTRLAPRPRVLEETGLSEAFVADLSPSWSSVWRWPDPYSNEFWVS